MCKKRFSLVSGKFYDGKEALTDEQVLKVLNAYNTRVKEVSQELYHKDRILEDNNIPIECCDE